MKSLVTIQTEMAMPDSDTVNVGPSEKIAWEDMPSSERVVLSDSIKRRFVRGLVQGPYAYGYTAYYEYRIRLHDDGSFIVLSRRRLI